MLTTMKRLLLPMILITFAVICLSIVHIDNINKLDAQSNELRKKYNTEQYKLENSIKTSIVIP
ncbi:hypothetical protein GCM10007384_01490 [Aquimarina muelleri]|uniref:Uncharacterized protein n=2 Tax=Aquimarina muelleri TaxID=279356 RepID=A0A918N2K6_9FLAO|nr:hypothetical protein GCM10007384_01490 [Aquimarina muelleri]